MNTLANDTDKGRFYDLVHQRCDNWATEILCQLGFCFCFPDDQFSSCFRQTLGGSRRNSIAYDDRIPPRFCQHIPKKGFYRKRFEVTSESAKILLKRTGVARKNALDYHQRPDAPAVVEDKTFVRRSSSLEDKSFLRSKRKSATHHVDCQQQPQEHRLETETALPSSSRPDNIPLAVGKMTAFSSAQTISTVQGLRFVDTLRLPRETSPYVSAFRIHNFSTDNLDRGSHDLFQLDRRVFCLPLNDSSMCSSRSLSSPVGSDTTELSSLGGITAREYILPHCSESVSPLPVCGITGEPVHIPITVDAVDGLSKQTSQTHPRRESPSVLSVSRSLSNLSDHDNKFVFKQSHSPYREGSLGVQLSDAEIKNFTTSDFTQMSDRSILMLLARKIDCLGNLVLSLKAELLEMTRKRIRMSNQTVVIRHDSPRNNLPHSFLQVHIDPPSPEATEKNLLTPTFRDIVSSNKSPPTNTAYQNEDTVPHSLSF